MVTLPRLNALLLHWEKCPPVHVSVALFMGVEAPTRNTAEASPGTTKLLTNEDIVRDLPDRRKLNWVNAPNG